MRELRQRTRTLDAQATSAAAELSSRREEELAAALGELQGLQGRVRGTLGVLVERRRGVEAALEASADENVVASLEADASKLATELEEVATRRKALDVDRSELRAAEDAARATARASSRRRGGPATPTTRWRPSSARPTRRTLARARDRGRARRTPGSSSSATATAQRLDELVALAGVAAAALTEAETARATGWTATARERGVADESADGAARAAEQAWRDRQDAATRSQARAEALERALAELTGAGGRDAIGDLDGVLGALVDLVDVDAGYELAVEAAIGASLAAVVVDTGPTARRALERLHREGAAGLVLPALLGGDTAPWSQGRDAAADVVRPRDDVVDDVGLALDRLLATAFCVDSLDAAVDLAIARPDLVVVTTAGDRLATSGWRAAAGSAVVTRAAVEEAFDQAAADAERAAAAEAALRAAREALEAARVARRGGDRRAGLGPLARARRRPTRSSRARGRAAVVRRGARPALRDSSTPPPRTPRATRTTSPPSRRHCRRSRTPRARAPPSAAAGRPRRAQTIEAKQAQVTELATELALAEASLEERGAVLEAKLTEVERRLTGHAVEREEASLRRRRLEADLSALDALAGVVADASSRVDAAHESVGADYREQLEAARAGGARLEELRRERADADATLAESNERERELEVEATGVAARLDALAETVRRELGVELAAVARHRVPAPRGGDDARGARRGARDRARRPRADQPARARGAVRARGAPPRARRARSPTCAPRAASSKRSSGPSTRRSWRRSRAPPPT